ncbi:MAG: hypothetical protein DRJ52_10970, partial [Thermoprotei archaeon]
MTRVKVLGLILLALILFNAPLAYADTNLASSDSGSLSLYASVTASQNVDSDSGERALTLTNLPTDRTVRIEVNVPWRIEVTAAFTKQAGWVKLNVTWRFQVLDQDSNVVAEESDTIEKQLDEIVKTWTYSGDLVATLTVSGYSSYTVKIRGYVRIEVKDYEALSEASVHADVRASASAYYPDLVVVHVPDLPTVPVTIGGTTLYDGDVFEAWESEYTVSAPEQVVVDGAEYKFDYWETQGSGARVASTTSPSTTLSVFGDGDLYAIYTGTGGDNGGGDGEDGGSQPKTYTLTISVSPPSGGTTSPAPGTYEYQEGSSVTVRAYANSGYRLAYWLLDGAKAGTTPTITVVMDRDHTLTAVFESTSLDYYHRYVVKEVKAYVHYSNAFGEILDSKSEKLLPFEYFVVLVE